MEENRKNWAALLGCPGTKRKIYLEHAAGCAGLHVLFIDWKMWNRRFWENWLAEHGTAGILKIDPPLWNSAKLSEFPSLTAAYQEDLKTLGEAADTWGYSFLNHPGAIAGLLDKRACKQKLAGEGLWVTQEIFADSSRDFTAGSWEELLAVMKSKQISQVFIKPNYGSGALGVTAFRIQHRTGKMVLYTCAAWDEKDNCLVNTKKIQRMEEREKICVFLTRLLEMDCMVERWYAKAEHNGCAYDLRAVVQDGRLDFLLARLSKGPITNLHLNNHPLPAEELHLPARVLDEVEELAVKAMDLYPGLRSAGIDILLEKGSLRPRIIEMNGQGDLIYQDIYHENRIYRHQAEMMILDKEVEEGYGRDERKFCGKP